MESLVWTIAISLTTITYIHKNRKRKRPQSQFRFLLINDVYKPKNLAQLPNLLEKYRAEEEVAESKFVIAGDFLGGSTFAAKSEGKSIIDILNAIGTEILVLGNHEFDYGSEVTAQIMKRASGEWFGSNARNLDGSLFENVTDVKIIKSGGLKIGIFGVLTSNTVQLSNPGPNVKFEDYFAHAKRCVELLEGNCDLIVALTHLNIEQDKRLCKLPIDAILGGHDHTPFHLKHSGTTILKCGQDAEYLGIVDIDIRSKELSQVRMIPTNSIPRDEKVMKIIDDWRSKYFEDGDDRELCKVVDSPLSSMTAELRSKETNFGTLVADALKWYITENYATLIDAPLIGIINGGFIRANQTYDVGETLKVFDVKEELPFPRSPILMELKGSEFLKALEEMLVKLPLKTGAFPQFSTGVKATFRHEAPRMVSMEIDGEPLIPDKNYLIVISDAFYIKELDGVKTYQQKGRIRKHCKEKLISEVVAEYFSYKGSISGVCHGRMLLAEM